MNNITATVYITWVTNGCEPPLSDDRLVYVQKVRVDTTSKGIETLYIIDI